MNLKRYAIAGGASLVVHAALLFVSQETKVFAMPAGNPTSSVSLNLVSAPKSVQAEPTPQEVVEEKQPEPQKKPQPKPEPVKKAVEKPVVKKDAIKKKPVVKKPKPVKKPQTSKPVAKKDPQPKEKVEKKVAKEPVPQQKAAPTEQSKGATSQPVMIDQPAFVSQPVQPRYPRSARKRGIEGVALYEVWLDANGNQIKQVLIESSGAQMLDVSALRAIKQWQFSPHISGGQKVAHRVQIPVRFKLDG
ncbi:energy transducer TonB [Vibrio campbellii]|uniref:Energy transducer TonB n=1 Tax=Vibrio campbellii TaxID=680 RepID=A0ABY5IJ09_9VIBR|nr:energy transducer TonB [Vibrio campbellii]UTZ24383.1 energy transducer TonB [Vibrio campbellii]UTZ33480.1 energy transducer TonB [Vibrio campbellii]